MIYSRSWTRLASFDVKEQRKTTLASWSFLSVALSIAFGFLAAIVPIQPSPPLFATISVVLVALLSLTALFVFQSAHAIFSPAGLPLQYIALSLVLPAFYAAVVGFDADYLQDHLTQPVLTIFLLFILGATVFTLRRPGRENEIGVRPTAAPDLPAARITGILLIVVAMAYRIYFLRMFGRGSWNEVRGVDLSLQSQLEVFASFFPILGVLLLLLADHKPRPCVIGYWPCLALAAWAGVSLLLGTRGEVVGPALILLWAYNYRVKRLRLRTAAPIFILGVVFLGAVGVWRSGRTLDSVSGFFLQPMVSPTDVTSRLLSVVPQHSEYLYGETYLDALRYAIPGLLPTEVSNLSAAFRFPHVVSYEAPSGLGFAIPTEAYWNFGLTGVLLAGVLLGWLLSWSYRRARAWPTSAMHLLYPLVFSQVPLLLRADFLAFYKATLYFLVAVGLVRLFERGFSK